MTGADLINLVESNGQSAEWHVTKYERVVSWVKKPTYVAHPMHRVDQYTAYRTEDGGLLVERDAVFVGKNGTEITCHVDVRQDRKLICSAITILDTPETGNVIDPYPGFDMLRGNVVSLTLDKGRPDILAAFEASA